MYLHRASWVCLSSAVLLLLAQPQVVAQTPIGQSDPTPTAIPPVKPLAPYAALPDLPPIQPIFPEPAEEVRLVLKLRERRVYVYQGDKLKTSYPVAVGRSGWETPTGEFQVMSMLENPGWTNPFTREVVPPGPNNPLGERWIAFWTDGNNYVGFHGTPNRESIGRAASHGCVRMYNEHVRELYEMVTPGTPVIVQL